MATDGSQEFCLRWNNHQATIISVFDYLLENETLVDCTLAAEGQYLKAHKVVLCACSPYLELLLSQHNDKHPILIFKDIKFNELKSMIDYMYKGEVNIAQDQLNHFLKAAESLQIKGLSESEDDATPQTATPTPRPPPPRAPPAQRTQPRPFNNAVAIRSTGPSDADPDSPKRIIGRPEAQSPTPRKRRRQAPVPGRPSLSGDDASNASEGHFDQSNCDVPTPAHSTSTSLVPSGDSEKAVAKVETNSELMLEPKTEYDDNSVEDITLDDDDEDYSQAGTSQMDNSQGNFGNWQQMVGDQTGDDVFSGQDTGAQNSQDFFHNCIYCNVRMKNDINSFVKHVYCCINSKFNEEKKCIVCRKFKGEFDHVIRHIMNDHKLGVTKKKTKDNDDTGDVEKREPHKLKRRTNKTMDVEESNEPKLADIGPEKKRPKSKEKKDSQTELPRVWDNVSNEADVSSREKSNSVNNKIEHVISSSSKSSSEDESISETKQSKKERKRTEKKIEEIATKKKAKDNDNTGDVENTGYGSSEEKENHVKIKKRNKKEENADESKKIKKKRITNEMEAQININDNHEDEEKTEEEKSFKSNLSEHDIENTAHTPENSTKKTKKVKSEKKDTDDKISKTKNSSVNQREIDSIAESDIEEIPIAKDTQGIAIVDIGDESDSLENNHMRNNDDESDLNSNHMNEEYPSALITTFHQYTTVRPDMSETNTMVAIISTSQYEDDDELKQSQVDGIHNDPKPLLEINRTEQTFQRDENHYKKESWPRNESINLIQYDQNDGRKNIKNSNTSNWSSWSHVHNMYNNLYMEERFKNNVLDSTIKEIGLSNRSSWPRQPTSQERNVKITSENEARGTGNKKKKKKGAMKKKRAVVQRKTDIGNQRLKEKVKTAKNRKKKLNQKENR